MAAPATQRSPLEIRDKLLLSQLLYAHGNKPSVLLPLLHNHPLLTANAKGALWTPTFLSSTLQALLSEVGYDFSLLKDEDLEDGGALKDLIKAQETEFEVSVKRIDAIRFGRNDEAIRQELAKRNKNRAVPLEQLGVSGGGREGKEIVQPTFSNPKPSPDIIEIAALPAAALPTTANANANMINTTTTAKKEKKQQKKRESTTATTPAPSVSVASPSVGGMEEEDAAEEEGGSPSVGFKRKGKVGGNKKKRRATSEADERSVKKPKADEVLSPALSGPSSSTIGTGTATDPTLQKSLESLCRSLLLPSASHIFHLPVKRTEAPNYYSVIHRPTDLKTITKKVKEGGITSPDELRRDLLLMTANSVMFNRRKTEFMRDAEEMSKEVELAMDRFAQRTL
ncbi:hypothetical protein BT69DRAFT_1333516 [Atractiella rhizophila]|nr:hypothetical protein BT69DRAFT_1333516 [Atractiella rhizophila]